MSGTRADLEALSVRIMQSAPKVATLIALRYGITPLAAAQAMAAGALVCRDFQIPVPEVNR